TGLTPTAISPFSLHDALPIYRAGLEDVRERFRAGDDDEVLPAGVVDADTHPMGARLRIRDAPQLRADGRTVRRGAEKRRRLVLRSEEHTSELQSRSELVCRLL